VAGTVGPGGAPRGSPTPLRPLEPRLVTRLQQQHWLLTMQAWVLWILGVLLLGL